MSARSDRISTNAGTKIGPIAGSRAFGGRPPQDRRLCRAWRAGYEQPRQTIQRFSGRHPTVRERPWIARRHAGRLRCPARRRRLAPHTGGSAERPRDLLVEIRARTSQPTGDRATRSLRVGEGAPSGHGLRPLVAIAAGGSAADCHRVARRAGMNVAATATSSTSTVWNRRCPTEASTTASICNGTSAPAARDRGGASPGGCRSAASADRPRPARRVRDSSARASGGPNDRPVRQVHRQLGLLVEADAVDVADDPHDLERRAGAASDAEPLADRILPRPKARGCGRRHDRVSATGVGLGKNWPSRNGMPSVRM